MKTWRLLIPTLALVVGMTLPVATSYASTPAPSAPTNVMAWAGNGSARVSWESPMIAAIYTLSAHRINVYLDGKLIQSREFSGAATEEVVTGLTNYRTYTFTVQLKQSTVGPGAEESVWSPGSGYSNPVVPSGGALPGSPSAVDAHGGTASALVTWTAPASASAITAYQVTAYGTNGSTWYPVQQVRTATSPTLTWVYNLVNGQSYRFTVRASNAAGWGPESPLSTPAISPSATYIAGPTVQPVVTGYGSVTVSWSGVPGANHYMVILTGTDNSVLTFRDPAVSPVTITGLTNGASYIVGVRYVTAQHLVSAATRTPFTLTASPTAPAPVTSVHAVVGNGQATVSWLPASNGGSAITSYVVAFSANPNDVAAVIHPATDVWMFDGSRWNATVYGLTNGRAYTFYVYAFNAVGRSGVAVSNTIIPTAPAQAPAAVTGVQAVAGNGKATVSWLPASDGGSAVTNYIVAYSANPYDVAAIVHPATDGGLFNGVRWSITISGLTNGKAYTFYVYAINAVGTSPWAVANTVTPVVPARAPDAVTGIQAVAGNGTATVSWLPAYDGGSPITSYVVSTSADVNNAGAVRAIIHPSTDGGMFSGGRWTTTITGLANGGTYTFYVFALNSIGASSASISNAITLPTVPGTIRNLKVTPGDDSLVVTWDAPSSNGGLAISGYALTASDGIHSAITLNVTGTTATFTGLTNGTGYTVMVRAINAVGSGEGVGIIGIPVNVTPTISVPGAMTVDHGDVVNATVTATGPESTDHLVLSATGLPSGVTFTDKGNGIGVLSGNAEVPAGIYTVTFTANDGHNPAATGSMTLTVVREQAEVRLLSTAPRSIVLKASQTKAQSITVRATIREATDPNGNADIGEAADVTYTLTSLYNGATFTGKATTAGHGIEATMTAKYTFRNIPRGIYELRVSVGGNFYKGTAEAMIAVSSPSVHGGVTGNGQVQVPGNNATAQFQINAARNKSGALSGKLSYTEQNGADRYTFKSTSITAIVFKNHTAYVQGFGTLNGTGGYQFVATLVDNHHNGGTDRFGLRVIDSTFATVNHCTFGAVNLMQGQARILHT